MVTNDTNEKSQNFVSYVFYSFGSSVVQNDHFSVSNVVYKGLIGGSHDEQC